MDSKTVCCLIIGLVIASAIASPVSKSNFTNDQAESDSSESKLEIAVARRGRQFGYPGGFNSANANAFASSSSQNIGGGYPGGFGGGFSASNAQASAGSNSFDGFGIGK